MGRPRLHDQSTERDLLAAAEALLAEGGAEALSVRRVAEAAGTTARAIYSVFGGKEGLLRALYREAFHALSADLDRLPATDDPLADLVAYGAVGFRGWAQKHPDLFRIAFSEAAPVGPPESVSGLDAFARLRQAVRRCIDAGLMPPHCELEVALSFHVVCEGLAGFEARRRSVLIPDQDTGPIWTSALGALVRGYRV
jgi:AcrR family transcriptional regulator